MGDEAMVDLRVVWYRQDTMTVQQADWRLNWKMTEGNWQIVNEARLAEPQAAPAPKQTGSWP